MFIYLFICIHRWRHGPLASSRPARNAASLDRGNGKGGSGTVVQRFSTLSQVARQKGRRQPKSPWGSSSIQQPPICCFLVLLFFWLTARAD